MIETVFRSERWIRAQIRLCCSSSYLLVRLRFPTTSAADHVLCHRFPRSAIHLLDLRALGALSAGSAKQTRPEKVGCDSASVRAATYPLAFQTEHPDL